MCSHLIFSKRLVQVKGEKNVHNIVHNQIPLSFIVYQVIIGDDRYLWFFKTFYSIYKFIFFG